MLTGIWRYFGIVLIIGVMTCQNRTNLEDSTTESTSNGFNNADDLGKNTDLSSEDYLTAPIDIIAIKNRFSKYSTSGVLPLNERKRYPTSNSNGFLGFYELLENEQSEIKYIGHLIVHVNGTPEKWRYDNTDETFVSIRLYSGNILIWNRLGIGSSESDVLKFINGNFHYEKGSTLYCEIGDFSIEFTITEGTVTELEVIKMYKSN
jgi:hypothetical protein